MCLPVKAHLLSLQCLDHQLSDRVAGGRILAGDQVARLHGMGLEVGRGGHLGTQFTQFGFEQERHVIGEFDRSFFTIGKTGDITIMDQRCTVGTFGIDQGCRAVTDGSDDFLLLLDSSKQSCLLEKAESCVSNALTLATKR